MGAVGAVTSTGARGPGDMIKHLLSHGKSPPIVPPPAPGSRPRLNWRPGCLYAAHCPTASQHYIVKPERERDRDRDRWRERQRQREREKNREKERQRSPGYTARSRGQTKPLSAYIKKGSQLKLECF